LSFGKDDAVHVLVYTGSSKISFIDTFGAILIPSSAIFAPHYSSS